MRRASSRAVLLLASTAPWAGCASAPTQSFDGGTDAFVRGDTGLARDGAPDAGDDAGPPIDAGAATWGVRSCDVTLRWSGGGTSVAVAGDFGAWTPEARKFCR